MERAILYVINFVKSGWIVSLLALLPFIQPVFDLTLVEVGFLSMTVSVVSIIAAYFASSLSSRFGTRFVMAVSISCYVLVWLGFMVVPSKEFLYVLFAFAGVSTGLFGSLATAVIARNAPKNKRGSEIGNFSAAGDLGRAAIVSLTTFLFGFAGMRWMSVTYLIAAVLFVAIFVVFVKKDPETSQALPENKRHSMNPMEYLRNPVYRNALFAGILDSFASSSLPIFLPFLLTLKGVSLGSTGFFTALFFLGYLAGRIVLGRFADKYGAAHVLIAGEIAMAALIGSLVLIDSRVLIIANLFLLGIFTRGTTPVVKAMISEGISEDKFEEGYSLYSSSTKASNSLSRPVYAFVGNFLGIPSIFFGSALVALSVIVPATAFYKAQGKKEGRPSEVS